MFLRLILPNYCPTAQRGQLAQGVGNTININDQNMNMNGGYYDEEDDAPPPPASSPTEQTATLDQFIKSPGSNKWHELVEAMRREREEALGGGGRQAGGGLEVGMIEFYSDDGARRIGDVSLSMGGGGLYGNGAGANGLPGGVAGEKSTIYHPDYCSDAGSYRDEEDPESPLALATDTQQLAMNEFINAPNEDRWQDLVEQFRREREESMGLYRYDENEDEESNRDLIFLDDDTDDAMYKGAAIYRRTSALIGGNDFGCINVGPDTRVSPPSSVSDGSNSKGSSKMDPPGKSGDYYDDLGRDDIGGWGLGTHANNRTVASERMASMLSLSFANNVYDEYDFDERRLLSRRARGRQLGSSKCIFILGFVLGTILIVAVSFTFDRNPSKEIEKIALRSHGGRQPPIGDSRDDNIGVEEAELGEEEDSLDEGISGDTGETYDDEGDDEDEGDEADEVDVEAVEDDLATWAKKTGWCDHCQWKHATFSCQQRVEWEMTQYEMTEREAKEANLAHCTSPDGKSPNGDAWRFPNLSTPSGVKQQGQVQSDQQDDTGDAEVADGAGDEDAEASAEVMPTLLEEEAALVEEEPTEEVPNPDLVGVEPEVEEEPTEEEQNDKSVDNTSDSNAAGNGVQKEIDLVEVVEEDPIWFDDDDEYEAEVINDIEEENLDDAPSLDNWCGECQWKSSAYTCEQRVEWEVKEYYLTGKQAREANLEYCTTQNGDGV